VTNSNQRGLGADEGKPGSSSHPGDAERREQRKIDHGMRAAEIGTLVRVLLLIWEVIRTLFDEHVFPGGGPGPVL
jgi:hypothetical protein